MTLFVGVSGGAGQCCCAGVTVSFLPLRSFVRSVGCSFIRSFVCLFVRSPSLSLTVFVVRV